MAVYTVLFGLNFGQNRPFFALQKSNFGFAFENERTVREALFNGDFCIVAGENNISANKHSSTTVSNDRIINPQGPNNLSDTCGGHKNMDNDPRVWQPIMDYVIQSFED